MVERKADSETEQKFGKGIIQLETDNLKREFSSHKKELKKKFKLEILEKHKISEQELDTYLAEGLEKMWTNEIK